MPNLKYIILVIFLASAGQLAANEANVTGWMDEPVFKQYFNAQSDDLYPVMIEARPTLGDGVQFRVLFIKKPYKGFVYRAIYGASDTSFDEAKNKHKSEGFVLIHHQKETLLMGKVHQAIWVQGAP